MGGIDQLLDLNGLIGAKAARQVFWQPTTSDVSHAMNY